MAKSPHNGSFLADRLEIAKRLKRPSACDGCVGNPSTEGFNPLFSGGFIPPSGPLHAPLMVIAISGGEEEEEMHAPLVGPSGRRADRAIEHWVAGRKLPVRKYNIYNCRSLKVGKQGKVINRTPPSYREMRDCASRWLFPELRTTKSKCVLILGTDAHNFLMGPRFGGFGRAMGHRLTIKQQLIEPAGLPWEIVSYGEICPVSREGKVAARGWVGP